MLEFQWLWGFLLGVLGDGGCIGEVVGSGGKGWDCGGFGW